MRNRAACALLLTLALLAGCTDDPSSTRPVAVPAPSATPTTAPADTSCAPRASLRPGGPLPAPGRMPAGTHMAKVLAAGRLVLGTSQDSLLFSSRNPLTGEIEGFDIDMGRRIAEAIFGDPGKLQIKVIPHAERTDVVRDGKVDLVINTMTANCTRWRQVDFSTIYFEAGQRVLVGKDSAVDDIADLGGKKVCSAVGSTSLANIAKVPTRPVPVARPGFGECLVAFQQNEVDAISTDDTILAGLAAQDPYAKVVGPRFTEEPYAIAIAKDHPEFTRFVNAVLERDRRDGTWAATYKTWLGRFGATPQPPAAQYR